MIFLIEFDCFNLTTNQVETQRFATDGFTTKPSDTPANVSFDERVQQSGNYQRSVFANGTTAGESDAAFGYIELANADGGLDYLTNVAVDGRALRIYGLESRLSPWSSRTLLFKGTMEFVNFSWTIVTINIRDRLFALRENIQPITYTGVTISGGLDSAEGTPEDLKAQPKPLLFGKALNFAPPLPNRFDRIYQTTSRTFNSGIIVRDSGVPLTFTSNYATIQTLRTASLVSGQFATATSLGLFRVGGTPLGDITVDAAEGADGSRSAPRTVRRILEGFGLTTADFSVSDIEALHTKNPAEVGLWLDTANTDVLSVISPLLDSIGATVVPDRLGVLRFLRIEDPSTRTSEDTFDRYTILDQGSGLQRVSTNDQGRGLPAKKVTINYAFNYTIQSGTALAGATTEAFKAFAKEDFRTVVAEDTSIVTKFLLAPELEFDTFLIDAAAAQAEATRRLNLYKVKRDRFTVPIKTELVGLIDLGSVITIKVNRFGLDAGKKFLVIGLNENYKEGITTLDVYG